MMFLWASSPQGKQHKIKLSLLGTVLMTKNNVTGAQMVTFPECGDWNSMGKPPLLEAHRAHPPFLCGPTPKQPLKPSQRDPQETSQDSTKPGGSLDISTPLISNPNNLKQRNLLPILTVYPDVVSLSSSEAQPYQLKMISYLTFPPFQNTNEITFGPTLPTQDDLLSHFSTFANKLIAN